ncbi:MAG: hypothetical protein A3K10_04005 [Bacteroidetes bacterium RIFCSPLOWO2_12_FULL_31_6]|nr:MAG: hypothetical protein A3K10_04005 [Bacteroidetes bacterium RIFCSPLOWO2_12_FULL_31_6]
MKAVVITAHNQSDLGFLASLFKRLGISSKVIDIEEIEDLGLSEMMKEVDRTKKVSRETIMKKLKAKS